MKVSLDNSSANTIIAYDVGMVRVHTRPTEEESDNASRVRQLTQSAIITPSTLVDDWQPRQAYELVAGHMQEILEFAPEIVILGTGRQLRFPANDVIEICYQAGAGVEVMDTGAACRTYNILAAEGRRVVAALIMIENEEAEQRN